MTTLIQAAMQMEAGVDRIGLFPHAPDGWTMRMGQAAAKAEGLSITDDHWKAVRAMQEYFSRHEQRQVNMRELHDALDEAFHASGGMKYLYKLFPGGPVAQGCRIAGLWVPPGAVDRGFGSVV